MHEDKLHLLSSFVIILITTSLADALTINQVITLAEQSNKAETQRVLSSPGRWMLPSQWMKTMSEYGVIMRG